MKILLIHNRYQQLGVHIGTPHNIFITILSRTGLMGLTLWMLFNLYFIKSIRGAICNPRVERKDLGILTGLFLYYVSFVVMGSFQPMIDSSYRAVSFYFLIGFTLYLMRAATKKETCMNDKTLEKVLS